MTFQYQKRLFVEPNKSYFLFGPRGTGKSTMVQKRHEKALVIDLRIVDVRRQYSAMPDLLLEVVRAEPEGQTIIIDEIQKVPELLSLVHILIEEKRKWKFILTGSSARKLKREGVDLLGGRALHKTLHPFMAIELGDQFDLEECLQHGLLPLRFEDESPQDTLSTYLSLYLEEEVKSEGLVRDIDPFSRFLVTMSFSHGSILNITNIARECYVKRTTVDSWISILEDLLIGYQLSIFTHRAKRELSSHPKFYFFDVGVFRAIRPYSIGDPASELDGMGLEGLIAQHLYAWKDYTQDKHTLHFWRTRSGLEVDFVLFGPLGLFAIEVKNSIHIHPQDLNGLNAFLTDYPEATAYLLYRGKHRLKKGNVLCIPCEEFLTQLTPNQTLFTI
ncbi:MAG: ATP-binding protein [Chlamydiia bacterium]|nr:ATP-binding protein [Chlamydiia bacterium]